MRSNLPLAPGPSPDEMNRSIVGLYTIGQSPRPDLTRDVANRFDSTGFEVAGALDGLSEAEIPKCGLDGYPLETCWRDGTRVVVDVAFLETRLQRAIAERDAHVSAHLVLCAGPFPNLSAHKPLIRPFDVGVAELTGGGLGVLEIVVPFTAQAAPATAKWYAAGFSCRAHSLAEKPRDLSVPGWLMGRLSGASADALVFDYVGFEATTVDEVSAQIDLPVIDLGQLAMDTLERTLQEL